MMNETTLSASLDSRLLSDTLQTKLPFPSSLHQCVPLAGDASNRRYFRLHLHDSVVSSLILMQLADPEGFKSSEEAVNDNPAEIKELPFVNILRHLRHVGIAVPTLYYFDERAGLLYLEDFGDLTLARACGSDGGVKKEQLYSQAIDQLVKIHVGATIPPDPSCLAFQRHYTESLLMWEFDHFLEFGVEVRQGRRVEINDKRKIRGEFQKISKWLASLPHVFTHRDFHSRNLMVDGERLGVIDFQDALMGPATYDLASLLRDSYIELEEDLIDRLIVRYMDGLAERLNSEIQDKMLLTNRIAFRRMFDLTSIQRNLKAAGRFVYIDHVKHNPNFLADIPRTLGYVRVNLEHYSELQSLRNLLGPYVPEWQ